MPAWLATYVCTPYICSKGETRHDRSRRHPLGIYIRSEAPRGSHVYAAVNTTYKGELRTFLKRRHCVIQFMTNRDHDSTSVLATLLLLVNAHARTTLYLLGNLLDMQSMI